MAERRPLLRYQNGQLELIIRVQPGASATGWSGLYGDQAIRLRLAAPPVDGKANAMLIRFLAAQLQVAASQVHLEQGALSRSKRVVAQGVAQDVAEKLAHALGLPL